MCGGNFEREKLLITNDNGEELVQTFAGLVKALKTMELDQEKEDESESDDRENTICNILFPYNL